MKRWLSLLLAICLLGGLFALPVSAAGKDPTKDAAGWSLLYSTMEDNFFQDESPYHIKIWVRSQPYWVIGERITCFLALYDKQNTQTPIKTHTVQKTGLAWKVDLQTTLEQDEAMSGIYTALSEAIYAECRIAFVSEVKGKGIDSTAKFTQEQATAIQANALTQLAGIYNNYTQSMIEDALKSCALDLGGSLAGSVPVDKLPNAPHMDTSTIDFWDRVLAALEAFFSYDFTDLFKGPEDDDESAVEIKDPADLMGEFMGNSAGIFTDSLDHGMAAVPIVADPLLEAYEQDCANSRLELVTFIQNAPAGK